MRLPAAAGSLSAQPKFVSHRTLKHNGFSRSNQEFDGVSISVLDRVRASGECGADEIMSTAKT
jgi:hypothetical protein